MFKYTPSNEIVKSTMANTCRTTLKCFLGKDVTGSGAWKKLGNLGRFAAAISAVHSNRGQADGYTQNCTHCYQKFKRWNYSTENVPSGCLHHSGNPKFFTTGNPCSRNIKWRNFRKLVCEKTKNLPVCQASMLNPKELTYVMKYCLHKGDLWHLELAVITLLSCSAYVRNNEMKRI